MIFNSGTATVSSAGTRVQLSNTLNKVRWIKVKALAGNSGLAYFGISDVSATKDMNYLLLILLRLALQSWVELSY